MLSSDTLLRSLTGFVEYVRKKGLQVSPAEAADAVQAVQVLAPLSLSNLREVLRPCMVKSVAGFKKFDDAFDEYFLDDKKPVVVAVTALASLEAGGSGRKKGKKWSRGASGSTDEDTDGHRTEQPVPGRHVGWKESLVKLEDGTRLPESFRLFMAGEKFSAAAELARNPLTDADRKAITAVLGRLAVYGELTGEDLPAVTEMLREYVELGKAVEKSRSQISSKRDVSDRRIETGEYRPHIHAPVVRVDSIPPDLLNARLEKLDRKRLALLTAEIERAAAALKPFFARTPGPASRKKALDYRKTLHGSLATFCEPFKLFYSAKRRKLRRVVTVCDLSGSVKNVTGLYLAFMYGLHQAFEGRARHFVFVSEIDEVTPYFSLNSYEECFDRVTRAAAVDYRGFSNYGKMLRKLFDKYRDAFDHETVVMFLGDARTNKYDPEADIMAQISAMVKKLFFLNPEDPREWHTGDSAVAAYKKAAEFVDVSRFGRLLDFLGKLPGVVVG
ncbi:VWA containing CoxE family protein [Desulfofundulus kuznetsovii DSM 6115]|uniref:VWA containing CoxE family protein n=1 Tax=Desulfofundulus kuznetsovii (strain DSM 6115 / VKM B-1805 / 17) TaxID=760568 RepID=A0AAU8P9C6_DESK7|nr:VWA containing CoxE family protein [Desulfofundulus kuznetsovii DSM 6115]